MASFFGGRGGGGGSASGGGNLLVPDDTAAAALTALKKGNTIRIASSGPDSEVKSYMVMADAATYAAATLVELPTDESIDDATIPQTAATEAARLALADKYNPFRIVRQTDTGQTWLQFANPASDPNSWTLISSAATKTVTDAATNVTDGGAIVTNTGA